MIYELLYKVYCVNTVDWMSDFSDIRNFCIPILAAKFIIISINRQILTLPYLIFGKF